MCKEDWCDCTTFEFHFIVLLIRRWTKSCTLTQSFISGLTGLLVFSSSTEFPFFLQLGVTSHYNPVVNMKPLTHYSMLLYKQLPQETGQVSSVGGGYFFIFVLPYRYVPPQRVWFLHRFGLRTDIDFTHFDLNSGKVSEGTTGVYKRVCLFNSK